MMRLLVLGAAGMAGHVVSIYMLEKGYDVTTFTRRPFGYGHNVVGDACDGNRLRQLLLDGSFDVVINCIGLLNQAAENHPGEAIYLNSYLPHFVADVLKGSSTKLIHMSTDCVFAGNTGPYAETSFPDGRTFYDRTKALGEVVDKSNLTFRNSIIGPDMNPDGIGLFNWFMKQSGAVKGFTGALWTGVTTLTLAQAMDQAIEEGVTGLYNLVNDSNISKFELLQLFKKYFVNGDLTINPDGMLQLDKTLICTRKRDFSFQVPSYEQMIAGMRQWMERHQNLYPHYKMTK